MADEPNVEDTQVSVTMTRREWLQLREAVRIYLINSHQPGTIHGELSNLMDLRHGLYRGSLPPDKIRKEKDLMEKHHATVAFLDKTYPLFTQE